MEQNSLSRLVLAVDDHDEVRATTARVLRQHGFTVLEAASGVQALTISLSVGRAPDLLITEVIMPDLDGLELAGVLRRRYPLLPVLVTTGNLPDGAPKGDGRVLFLAKPYRPQDLIRCVRLLTQPCRGFGAGATPTGPCPQETPGVQ